MRVTLAPALAAFLLMAGACAMAADWPWFLGPDCNGIASDTGINKNWNAKPPQTLWKVTLSYKGYAGPSVADGKVFIIDHVGANDVVRALDFATGADIWRFEYPDAEKFDYGYARATPTYFDGKVYCQGRMGPLFCLDAATGRTLMQNLSTCCRDKSSTIIFISHDRALSDEFAQKTISLEKGGKI